MLPLFFRSQVTSEANAHPGLRLTGSAKQATCRICRGVGDLAGCLLVSELAWLPEVVCRAHPGSHCNCVERLRQILGVMCRQLATEGGDFTVSSTRFRNSGRKVCRSTSIRLSGVRHEQQRLVLAHHALAQADQGGAG